MHPTKSFACSVRRTVIAYLFQISRWKKDNRRDALRGGRTCTAPLCAPPSCRIATYLSRQGQRQRTRLFAAGSAPLLLRIARGGCIHTRNLGHQSIWYAAARIRDGDITQCILFCCMCRSNVTIRQFTYYSRHCKQPFRITLKVVCVIRVPLEECPNSS